MLARPQPSAQTEYERETLEIPRAKTFVRTLDLITLAQIEDEREILEVTRAKHTCSRTTLDLLLLAPLEDERKTLEALRVKIANCLVCMFDLIAPAQI